MSRTLTTNRFATALFTTIATLLIANVTVAQSSESYSASGPIYQPVSPYPVEMGFSQYHSSTAAEGFLRGRSALIQALGSFQLSESQAEILWQQARSLDRDNDLKQTAALLAQQKMWIDARTQAQTDRNARRIAGQQVLAARRSTVYRQAYQLSAAELDPTTGKICWPVALQAEKFQQQRERVEELLRQHVYGEPNVATANQLARSIDLLSRALRNDISSMPRDEYVASQKFLTGLKYAATTLAEAT